MSHQLAQRDRPLLLRVGRHVHLDHIVQLQASLLEQQTDCRGGEDGGSGPELEARLWSDGHLVFDVSPPEALGPDHLAFGADGDGDAGEVLLDHTGADDLAPTLDGFSPLSGRRRCRHRCHLLCTGVNGHCGQRQVGEHSHHRCADEANNSDQHREPGLCLFHCTSATEREHAISYEGVYGVGENSEPQSG